MKKNIIKQKFDTKTIQPNRFRRFSGYTQHIYIYTNVLFDYIDEINLDNAYLYTLIQIQGVLSRQFLLTLILFCERESASYFLQ